MAQPPKRPRSSLRATTATEVARGPTYRRDDPRQPELFHDPMPDRVEPCLALLASKPPAGDDWAFEVKWDGYRLAVHIDRGNVRIITRGGHDWTHRFPAIAFEAAALRVTSAIIDGEACVLDEYGASDFNALQRSLGGRGGKAVSQDAMLYAFDLLYLDGYDLRPKTLVERRKLLAGLIDGQGTILLSEEVEADGAAFLKQACSMGLEGIIAKRRSASYRSGRGGEWLKIKCVQSEGFVIIGYEPSRAAHGGIGRVLLAARSGDHLAYVGGVGTGFSFKSGTELREQLNAIEVPKPIVPLKRKGVIWTAPELVAEIEFRGWTTDQKLRHASYKGLRDEADVASVFDLERLP